MDQGALVKAGQLLLSKLDATGSPPRVALWVHDSDPDRWSLWVVPKSPAPGPTDFYKQVLQIIDKDRSAFEGLDASDVKVVSESNPTVRALGTFMHVPGTGDIRLHNVRMSDVFLPDGIVLRSAL
jgi:hypothetical protein